MDELAALRATLTLAAGAAGLAQLLAGRQALRDAAAARLLARQADKAAANAVRMARHDGAPTPWRAWFDGSAHPNPGRCGIGGLLLGPDGERVEITRRASHGNSSEAEIPGIDCGTGGGSKHAARDLTVYGDSRVVLDDMHAAESAAAPSLAALRGAARAWLPQLGSVVLRWIPRHKNSAADALSQQAARRCETLTDPAGS
ncbi:reverse transcriptase-like protein [Massilia sp. B-10]|nr:reverse transcriptase-like protein [Massilia sp. B-10]